MQIDTSAHVISQNWQKYTPLEHDIWRRLYARQQEILPNRATPAFLSGLDKLKIASEGIPRFDEISEFLFKETRWEVVAVKGLVPDDVFFALLANRQFPSTCFIRTPEQFDYLQEPDIFHDTFGHVPMLVHPVFADYMEAFGKAGLAAMEKGSLHYLARLYWFTVEFGLILTEEGLRIYGSGIMSSPKESVHCLESSRPNRISFDLVRCMRTQYRIDDLQDTYFVISSFEELINSTTGDFVKTYENLKLLPDFDIGEILPTESQIPPNKISH